MPTRPPGTPTVDLTSDDTFGIIDLAVFQTGQNQPAGTGTFNSFVQIQAKGSERGYNTDASPQFDEKNSHVHNHSILLADVPIVVGDGSGGTLEGVTYREFLLDLNESNGYVSLDALQIWQEESGSLTNFTPGSGFAGAHTNYLAYNMDGSGNHWVALNDGLSHGSGQSDVRILVPDSFFINDASHRYITLYSQFGLQSGWGSDGGFEEWGLHGASGGSHSALSIHKSATVADGTADTAGEVINYTITVSNTGNTALTGITVTDPTVSNLAPVLSLGFNIGDTNHDNQLSAGETWQYTANHTVTQDDIDTNGGGDGVIQNTATADSNETTPVSASALVAVEQRSTVDLVKTADVTSVDAAGNVITYSITVTNTGNTTLTDPVVEDSQVNIVTPIVDMSAPILGPELLAPVLNGDYNVGDVGTPGHPEFAQDGIQEPGETFVFKNAGDENGNGIQDSGETFLFTNVGDTNQNGAQDTGETFQFYNVGDTNHNGVPDDGETFQFSVSHAATTVDADHDGFNDGDLNHDGKINLGESWQYTVSYTVTQDDIDNGGVVNPALTHDNTATVTTTQDATDSGSVSVSVVQNPHVTLVKSASVADGTADAAGDVINYAINVTNDGNMTLTSPVVSDPSVSGLAPVLSGGFNSGDLDQDGKIDVGETWHYTASHTVTQGDIDNGGVVNPALTYNNTASVTTAQGTAAPNPDPDANDTGSASVPIVQNPHVTLVKSASVADGTADAAGDVINYAINVSNDGNMTLTGPAVSDPSVSNLAPVLSSGFNSGDLDHDGKIGVGETWHYTASHTVTQGDIDNGGVVNPALTYNNTASVTTAQGAADPDANDTGSASVPIVQNPHVVLDKTATVPGGTADTAGEVISYAITVHNDGNMTLTNPMVSDPSVTDLAAVTSGGFNAGDTDHDGKLDVGETWQYSASHTVTQSDLDTNGGGDGTIDNTASVTTNEGATSSDSASVTVVQPTVATMTFDKSDAVGTIFVDSNENGHADATIDLIEFVLQVHNSGTATLHGIAIDDPLLGGSIAGLPATLAPGATFNIAVNHFLTAGDVADGHVFNSATATALDPSNNLISVMAHYDQLLPA